MTTLREPTPEDNGRDVSVPITLSSKREKSVIGTQVDEKCLNGIGSLLRDEVDARRGLDVQLPCKKRDCPVCGPEIRRRKSRRILNDFGGQKMHAIEIEDGGKAWETMHKSLDRSGALYHRIPAPEGRAVIITDADVGDLVQDPEKFVGEAIASQPCSSTEKRRMTSSRHWKGAGGSARGGRWKRLGTTHLALEDRVRVYEEEGCQPVKVEGQWVPAEAVVAHDLGLPALDSPEMERITQRLGLVSGSPRRASDGSGWAYET